MRLCVLSPHRDDATFSLANALNAWNKAGAEITILNFFTVSLYAPFATGEVADVSYLRSREDRRSIRMTGSNIRIRSLELLDAPIRRNIEFGLITNPAAFQPTDAEVELLTLRIRSMCRASLILAPLALGDHIDHRTVYCAAVLAAAGLNVGFYEDLPYASWTAEELILERIRSAEQELNYHLDPVHQQARGWRFKARIAAQYRSQIDDAMVRTIARYGEKYNGAERIWIPRHSSRWKSLVRG